MTRTPTTPPGASGGGDNRELFLQPGDFYFGAGAMRLRTVLGSCVSITLWHPELRVGGMCHYLLPRRRKRGPEASGAYADEALELFQQALRRHGGQPREYQARMFGGGRMFASTPFDVAQQNISAGRDLLQRHGFVLLEADVGGAGHRQVIMELWSGNVVARRYALPPGDGR